jgi:protein-L-isoaspartate(D-aspartate) O-methyltransferase
MDWEKARFNMVEQQIRPWEVFDQTVLNLLFHVKREDFVPATHRTLALVDMAIPLGNGRYMWHPKLEARALQALALKATDRVLEIGVGSGYLTALMAKLARHVYGVEIDPALAEVARQALGRVGFNNTTIEVGDAARGWATHAPYDVIVAGGSFLLDPSHLFDQLNEGGRLFAVVGEEPVMSATLYTKTGGSVRAEKLFETVLPTLEHVPQPERFTF